jgi:hypothetical protein
VFSAGPIRLPDLEPAVADGALAPATRTYQLYPPLAGSPVQVGAFSAGGSAYKSWSQIPEHVMLLNLGARFQLTVISLCAKSSSRTYLLHGFAAPGAAPIEVPG